MNKILSIILMSIAVIGNAQLGSVQQQIELNHWFDLVEYDSLAYSGPDTSASGYWSKQTQTYFFWDNSKIHSWEENAGSYYAAGTGYWKDSLIEWLFVYQGNPQDTFDTERLYMDVQGRDSAYAYILDAYSVFEDRIITVLDYDSTNLVEKRIHINESWYNNFVADTSLIEWCFYDSNDELDSIILTDKDGVRYPGGYYFEKNNQGKVSKVFEIWSVNEKGGQLDTVAVQEAVYQGSLVDEIRYYSYDFGSGKDSIWFAGVLRFAKRKNSTIGIHEFNASSIELFPNPVKEFFNLKFESQPNDTKCVEVFDATGRRYILSASLNDSFLRVDCTSLPMGIFVGKYKTTSGEVMKFRFVK